MGIFPKYPVFFCAFCHKAPPGRCSFRRQAVRPRAPRGDASSAPQTRPNLSMRPEGALLKKALPSAENSAPRARDAGPRLPGGGRSAPPSLWGGIAATALLGRAASAALTQGACVSGDRSLFNQKGPPLRRAQWGTKRRCRLAVPEKNRRGSRCTLPHLKHKKHPRHPHNRGISAEMQCGTSSRAARDLTGDPCSPVNPCFWTGDFPQTLLGVQGPSSPCGAASRQ